MPQEAVTWDYEAVVYCLAACLLQITWIVFAQLMIWIQQCSRRVTRYERWSPRYEKCWLKRTTGNNHRPPRALGTSPSIKPPPGSRRSEWLVWLLFGRVGAEQLTQTPQISEKRPDVETSSIHGGCIKTLLNRTCASFSYRMVVFHSATGDTNSPDDFILAVL